MKFDFRSSVHNTFRRWEIEQKFGLNIAAFMRQFYLKEEMSCDEIAEMLAKNGISIGIRTLNRWLKYGAIIPRDRKKAFNLAIKRGRMDYEHQRAVKKYKRKCLMPKIRYEILSRDGFQCRLCGKSAKDGAILEVDHVVPISQGGQTEPENLQTLCLDCNIGKSALDRVGK